MASQNAPIVSVIIPCHNAEAFLQDTLDSVLAQTYRPIQVCAYDDRSTDGTWRLLQAWQRAHCDDSDVQCRLGRGQGDDEGGAGVARNQAVAMSTGEFLCFLDADDRMLPLRVQRQVDACVRLEAEHAGRAVLVGCRFRRDPPGSTERYTTWCNTMTQEQLWLQRFRECTLIQPTWLMRRRTFDLVGGYGKELAEDLTFFLQLAAQNVLLHRVDEELLIYRYHGQSLTHKVGRRALLRVRARAFEEQVLDSESGWTDEFSIWSNGRDAKDFFKALRPDNRKRVKCFSELNPAKIGTDYVCNLPGSSRADRHKIPIIDWREIEPPFVVCVALSRFEEALRTRIASLSDDLVEGRDYYFFI